MNLRRLWAIARKEALHIRRDPRSLGLAIGVPLLMLLAFGYVEGLNYGKAPVAVPAYFIALEALMRSMHARGIVIYLNVAPQILFERTRHDRNRPLLQVDNPRQRM